MRTPAALVALTLTLASALSGCSKADQAFDDRVHAYLMAHPEVIQEAMGKLQEKQEAQALATAKQAINQNRKAIERDPRDFVANPNGKVTVTEFYDYRCPHCVNVAPAVLQIIQSDPDVRVVFKEFPIFGPTSEKAAAGAIATKRAGGDYLAVYHDMMAARPLDTAAIDRILTAHGVKPDSLEQADIKAEVTKQLADVRQLAISLDIQGTPAFIIGDTMVPGEDIAAVKAAIDKAKGK
ncbi:MAG: DsbA family protein [Caulobacteraceae bacterium]|nr:DsbA family protein [Caulobacteraceae bacterium]